MLKKVFITICISVSILIWPLFAMAAPHEYYSFTSNAKHERFIRLTQELRCLVCKNQTIAESNAELAIDLRNEVYRKIQDGESNADILQTLQERYGDFILYQPPLKASTWVLWFGPFVLLFIGFSAITYFVYRTKKRKTQA